MPWPCPSIICRSQTGYPSIPKSVGILRVKISGHSRQQVELSHVWSLSSTSPLAQSCYIPICFLVFFWVISPCILYNIGIHRLYPRVSQVTSPLPNGPASRASPASMTRLASRGSVASESEINSVYQCLEGNLRHTHQVYYWEMAHLQMVLDGLPIKNGEFPWLCQS